MSNISKFESNFLLFLWLVYLLLFPFQFLPPGNIQIADLSIIIGLLIILSNYWVIDNYIKNLSYFVIYSFIISIYYLVIYGDIEFLKQPLNYTYCLFSLVFISQVYKNSKFISTTFFGLFFSLIIQLFVFKKLGLNQEQYRVTLFFNNPNQLGLWALSILIFLSLLILTKKNLIKNKSLLLISIILCYFFILLSISQAAIISSGIIFVILFSFFFRSKWIYVTFGLTIIIFIIIANKNKFDNLLFLNNVQSRIETEIDGDDGDNDLDGRNYTRLLKHPQYLIFGSGEGKVDRFGDNGLEIHSTFANIIFSYGIVGMIIFIIPILNFFKRKSLILSLLLCSYYFFTLVHNTIRWPFFWIIPYLLYLIPYENFNNNHKVNIDKDIKYKP
jgi:hypothetical protein